MTDTNIFGPGHSASDREVTSRPTQLDTVEDSDTWFGPCVDGDASTGTKITHQWLNLIIANLRKFVRSFGATQGKKLEDMLSEAASRAASLGTFGIDSGTANNYAIAAASGVVAPKAPFTGQRVFFTANASNDGASVADVFASGDRDVLTWDGAALTGGEIEEDYPTAWEYDATADGGNGAWLILPWANRGAGDAINAAIAAGGLYNIATIEDGVRTVVSGTGTQQYASFSYTKQRDDSDLYVLFSGLSYAPGGGTPGAAWAQIDVGGTVKVAAASNNTATNARGATVIQGLFTGLSAGAITIDIDYGRNDGLSWEVVLNPTSSDKSELKTGVVSTVMIAEIVQS